MINRTAKSLTRFVLLSAILALPLSANSEIRHGEVGGALYGTNISYDTGGLRDDRLSGLALIGTGIINQHFAIRGLLSFQSHNDVSNVDSRLFEGTVLAGGGLGTLGWKGYGGIGFFTDRWEASGATETFGGIQLTAGFGYNWRPVALDIWWTLRDSSDYEDFVGDAFGASVSATAVSFGIGVSGRF